MSSSKTRTNSAFTLVEIMIALAIVGGVVVVLLDQRVRAVQDAQKIRDRRVGWTLAAWKMSALELDEELLAGPTTTDAGTFEEYSTDYDGFVWELEATREKIFPDGELNPEGTFKEIMRLLVRVKLAGAEQPLVMLEGIFPAGETK